MSTVLYYLVIAIKIKLFFKYFNLSSSKLSMDLLLASKIISMVLLGLVTWLIGLVPLVAVRRGWLSRKESDGDSRIGSILSCLMCFGGGVIMTSSLAHMLPDVNDVLDLSLEHGTFPDTGKIRGRGGNLTLFHNSVQGCQ